MDGRLIFLHRLRRFDPHVCGFPKQILRLVVEVGGSVSCQLEPVLLAKSVERRSEKSTWGTKQSPVLKLTQVGKESILRRSRELRLRN
jgi:hypothetical protein